MVVLTVSYSAATELSANPLIQIMCLPGVFEGSEGIVHGPETLEAINRYHAPLAVMGASALNEEGISEAMPAAAKIWSAMIERSDKTIIMADHTKLNKRALNLLNHWDNRFHLVTDRQPDNSLYSAMKAKGVTVTIAPKLRES